ncbi:hypothetical protein G6F51_014515 [Rhizopus arrhizus]|uniref:Uncharacterized protein n=1 Tax=Rhizopus oryzae TaxID=64495 RepID=A0A9P7BYG8_RHIOR|nr:hypothetical protein G6F51_014515 [Rhizopus arrhizus]
MALPVPTSATSSAALAAGGNGGHTGPGATQLTRIPRGRSWLASALVNAWIAPLVAECGSTARAICQPPCTTPASSRFGTRLE